MSLLLLLGGGEGSGPEPETPIPPLHVFRRPTQTPGASFVRLQALDGMWETVGADRLRGVRAEGLSCTANQWGSDTCRFTLKRPPGGVFPDLTAFTPIEVYNEYGTLVWSGRIRETPSSSGSEFSIGVEGQGWQYHLDDDFFERTYVHSRLTEWRDIRSFTEYNATHFTQAGTVNAGDGALLIGFPNGAPLVQNTSHVGVVLDLGPDSTAERVVVELDRATAWPAATSYNISLRGADDISQLTGGVEEQAWADEIVNVAVTPSTIGGTFASPRRYVGIVVYRSGTTAASTADRMLKIRAARVFRSPAYESGGQSVFRAHHGIADALQFAPLLSQDTSLIQQTLFDIPDFSLTDDRKPREVMEALNALHNYRLRVTIDRRLEFGPRPDKPMFRVGPWSGADFKDASKNSGDEIFNKSIAKGTGVAGGPIKVSRYASQQADVALELVTSPAFVNPSFDTNTTGWTASTGSVARTTTAGTFDSAPAGLRWDPGSFDTLSGALVGDFVPGVIYVADFAIRHNLATELEWVCYFGGDVDFTTQRFRLTGSFSAVRATWMPRSVHSGATIRVPLPFADIPGALGYLDSFGLSVARPTLPDRRGFLRTHVHSMSQAIISEVGEQIADTFLKTHKRTPLKGDISVKGRHGVRRMQGDATVPPSELLLHTGEFVHLSDQIDPDTGALGRDAPMDSVTWNADDNLTSVALDAQRDNLAALIARHDLVAGPGSR